MTLLCAKQVFHDSAPPKERATVHRIFSDVPGNTAAGTNCIPSAASPFVSRIPVQTMETTDVSRDLYQVFLYHNYRYITTFPTL